MKTRRKAGWVILALLAALAVVGGVCLFTPLGQIVRVLPAFIGRGLQGPQVVESVFSPDMAYEAYVVEEPSIDPPNQTLFIQDRNEVHFVVVAHLGEDVDSIRQIYWSPDSSMVVFVSRNFLYAVHVPGYEMVGIPLANEFGRYQPGRFTSFGGGIPKKVVAEVSFPEPGVFVYRLEGSDLPQAPVHMAEMLDYTP